MSTPGPAAPPPGWPAPDATFVEAVTRAFRQYARFDGRASRREFWYFYLFTVGVVLVLLTPTIALTVATQKPGEDAPVAFFVGFAVFGLFYAGALLPMLAVACRRLHDAGLSGLYLLLGLITGVIPMILCALPTAPGAVRYGPPAPVPGFPGSPYGAVPQPYGGYAGPPPGHGQPGSPQGYGPQAPQAYGQPWAGPADGQRRAD